MNPLFPLGFERQRQFLTTSKSILHNIYIHATDTGTIPTRCIGYFVLVHANMFLAPGRRVHHFVLGKSWRQSRHELSTATSRCRGLAETIRQKKKRFLIAGRWIMLRSMNKSCCSSVSGCPLSKIIFFLGTSDESINQRSTLSSLVSPFELAAQYPDKTTINRFPSYTTKTVRKTFGVV